MTCGQQRYRLARNVLDTKVEILYRKFPTSDFRRGLRIYAEYKMFMIFSQGEWAILKNMLKLFHNLKNCKALFVKSRPASLNIGKRLDDKVNWPLFSLSIFLE